MNGRWVIAKEYENETPILLDVSNLIQGIYIVRIMDIENAIKLEKIIIIN